VRAIRFDGARVYLDPKADAPTPGPGEVTIRPLRMGVAAEDVHPGMVSGTPLTLGHQFVGAVEKLHESADRDLRKRWEGKRVVGSINIVCGRCDMCRAGLSNHCRARSTLGIGGWDGCFAERFKLPLRNLVEVPQTIDDDRAVFAEPLAGALHAAQLVRVEGKPYVTVLGDNVDGLLCAQVMARLNASVRLLGLRPAKFTLCEKWGIKHRHIDEVGRRNDQDIVVDCTGSGAGLELALGLVRPRGKVVLRSAAPPDPGAPGGQPVHASLGPIIWNEIEVLGARCGSVADAVATLARGEIDVLSLITRRARLADGPAALALAAGPDQIKVLLDV
jgi:threonine dehydrogenase-like Zn-dependent dehydrogenase